MRKIIKTCLLFGLTFLLLTAPDSTGTVFAQEQEPDTGEPAPVLLQPPQTIPDVLRRPQTGEPPRLPQDFEIGDLGQGQAPDGAYFFARNVLAALTASNSEAPALAAFPPALIENHIEEIGGIEPLSFRIGGGRIEADESVSFLVRFIGREESIVGELFLLGSSDSEGSEFWLLDDLILEEPRSLAEIRDAHRFIFSPYERFF